MLPIVHHSDYRLQWSASHSLKMNKYAALMDLLINEGLATEANTYSPEMPALATLALAHAPEYYQGFLDGTISEQQLRRIGVPWSPQLARRARRAVGGTLLTFQLAMEHGVACHTAGGAHHADYDHGRGYCVFNDVAIAALHAKANGISPVLIVDLDAHQGDGTARLLAAHRDLITFSMHGERLFPGRKAVSDWDIPIAAKTSVEDYFSKLDSALDKLFAEYSPELVIYIAGVDVHRDDSLAGMGFSTQDILARETLVIKKCLVNEASVACVLGGGYNDVVADLAALHCQVFIAAHGVSCGKFGNLPSKSF